jgi:hypothetical protein
MAGDGRASALELAEALGVVKEEKDVKVPGAPHLPPSAFRAVMARGGVPQEVLSAVREAIEANPKQREKFLAGRCVCARVGACSFAEAFLHVPCTLSRPDGSCRLLCGASHEAPG